MSHARREESGSAVVEFIVLGVVLLIPLVYLVMFMARIQPGHRDRRGPREGRPRLRHRFSPSGAAAPARAQAAADLAFDDQGFAGRGTIAVSCDGSPCLRPEGRISATARVIVPLPLIPAFARQVIPLEVPVSATHVSTVDRFRGSP